MKSGLATLQPASQIGDAPATMRPTTFTFGQSQQIELLTMGNIEQTFERFMLTVTAVNCDSVLNCAGQNSAYFFPPHRTLLSGWSAVHIAQLYRIHAENNKKARHNRAPLCSVMVGVPGFEPETSSFRTKRASQAALYPGGLTDRSIVQDAASRKGGFCLTCPSIGILAAASLLSCLNHAGAKTSSGRCGSTNRKSVYLGIHIGTQTDRQD